MTDKNLLSCTQGCKLGVWLPEDVLTILLQEDPFELNIMIWYEYALDTSDWYFNVTSMLLFFFHEMPNYSCKVKILPSLWGDIYYNTKLCKSIYLYKVNTVFGVFDFIVMPVCSSYWQKNIIILLSWRQYLLHIHERGIARTYYYYYLHLHHSVEGTLDCLQVLLVPLVLSAPEVLLVPLLRGAAGHLPPSWATRRGSGRAGLRRSAGRCHCSWGCPQSRRSGSWSSPALESEMVRKNLTLLRYYCFFGTD